ncbi:hypothetical protein ACFOTA_20595 [Chitinophaga sp. GCM10012297]|uniref:N-acetyltransferase domain-containing protein n=1 Tax=Chitinophaga chungangae TaxID=2821488 RepID=A0ABS3YIV7_9BACT|nr:hypothetical protein [Chitinophaga chungangae]MBO9154625.1 hypothetical protein [Chitinophaga chungangae]
MKLFVVKDARTAREFLDVHVSLNKGYEGWNQPLDKDIQEVFDPEKNKTFRFGECVRWVMKDEKGNLAGRIAAFVNKKYKTIGDEQPVGGVGFFDCVNDQQAANLLFDTAKQWLTERGMGAMDGPINFGDRDRWWGLQVKGFVNPPFGMNYNPPYYRGLFENYGFRPFFTQVCFGLDVKNRIQDKFYERHAAIAKDPAFSARHIRKKELEKYAQDFTTVYNKAWAQHGGLKEISKEQALMLFKKMKPVLDERIVWFAYHNDEPIALWVNLPELNQYFKHMGGKFGLLQKLQFLWLKMTGACRKFTGIVFGVVPEFQGKGVDAYLIVEGGAKVIQAQHLYDEYEMQWIGDFNPKMMNVAESLGTFHTRELITFRYLFDRTQEFKRHPILK